MQSRPIGHLRPIRPGQPRWADGPDLTGSGSLAVGKRPSPIRSRPLADLTGRRQVDAADLGDHPTRHRRAGRVPGRDRRQDRLGPGRLGDRTWAWATQLRQGRRSSTAIGGSRWPAIMTGTCWPGLKSFRDW